MGDAPTFSLIADLDQIFFVTPADATTAVNIFELKQTYKVNWVTTGFSNIRKVTVAYGLYSNNLDLTFLDADIAGGSESFIP
jgi:hypothetical protein